MTSIGIIGSGFGALSVAIEMRRAGHTDVRLWERADQIGGVWRDNTYPGAACDVPSPLYSFSYEPYPHWKQRYAHQPQILEYIRHVATKYGITPLVQTGMEVTGASWDDDAAQWTVTFADGTAQTVNILVSAVGQLSQPVLPAIPGVDAFEGTAFHSARWDHDVDLTGKRVAVVGTGASAIQFIPHIAEQAAHVTVFQRSAMYILPKPDQTYGRIWGTGLKHLPGMLKGERATFWGLGEQFSRGLDEGTRAGKAIKVAALKHLQARIKDPVLRAKLTPDYPIGCKRILFANSYYPAIARSNVTLVTDAISSITPTGVATATEQHDVDVIIYATGFDAQEFLDSLDITGVGGQKLATQWVDGARAYLGIYVPNFPNFFISYGPNTNLGGSSIIYMLEAQARHMRQAADALRSGGHRRVEVTPQAAEAFDQATQSRLSQSVWSSCDNWYRHPSSGRITSNWPGSTAPYGKATKTLDQEAFSWR